MNVYLKRSCNSFAISAFAALLVNLSVDVLGNQLCITPFISMSPKYVALFPTPVIATYVNILLYGLIGAVFAGMTFVFDIDRLGFLLQNVIYFFITGLIWSMVVILLWQLQNYPPALIFTLLGYAVTYMIIGLIQYNNLKQDISMINEQLQ